MDIVCNRFNPIEVIRMVAIYGSTLPVVARWQFSVRDGRGRHYDHYFVCKPTRKQLSAIKKKIRNMYMTTHHCYNCGKRIHMDDLFTLDDLNYRHDQCKG